MKGEPLANAGAKDFAIAVAELFHVQVGQPKSLRDEKNPDFFLAYN